MGKLKSIKGDVVSWIKRPSKSLLSDSASSANSEGPADSNPADQPADKAEQADKTDNHPPVQEALTTLYPLMRDPENDLPEPEPEDFDERLWNRYVSFERCWYGTRFLGVWSKRINPSENHVRLVFPHRSPLGRLWGALSRLLLPRFVHNLFRRLLPAWYLPPVLICKCRKGDDDEEEFANEKAMYARLRPLQGTVIPEYFGQVTLLGSRTPAHLIGYVDGFPLSAPAAEGIPKDEFVRLLGSAGESLAAHQVALYDPSPANFQLVDDGARVVVVDLETAHVVDTVEAAQRANRAVVQKAWSLYAQIRYSQGVARDGSHRQHDLAKPGHLSSMFRPREEKRSERRSKRRQKSSVDDSSVVSGPVSSP